MFMDTFSIYFCIKQVWNMIHIPLSLFDLNSIDNIFLGLNPKTHLGRNLKELYPQLIQMVSLLLFNLPQLKDSLDKE